MCDFSGCLIAWMDGELAEPEAAEVDRHVEGCGECRQRVSSYQNVSSEFATYYAAATQTAASENTTRKLTWWVPVTAGAAVAAVVLLVVLLLPSAKQVPPVPPVAAKTPSAPVEIATQQPKPVQRMHIARHRRTQGTNWAMVEPAIQIAIPAESMFPPGAVPEGITYIANLSFAADGTVQGLRLQP